MNIKWHQLHKVTVRIKGDDGRIALSKGAQKILSTSHPLTVTAIGSNLTANPSKINRILLLCHKKKWHLGICDTMSGLEGIMLSQIIQTEKEKYHMMLLICEIWKHAYINKPKQINRTECWLPKEKGQGRKIGENGLLYVDRRKLHFWCAYGVVDTKVKTQCCTRETSYAKDQCYFSWKEESKRIQLALSREFEHELALSLGLNMFKETVTWGNLAWHFTI